MFSWHRTERVQDLLIPSYLILSVFCLPIPWSSQNPVTEEQPAGPSHCPRLHCLVLEGFQTTGNMAQDAGSHQVPCHCFPNPLPSPLPGLEGTREVRVPGCRRLTLQRQGTAEHQPFSRLDSFIFCSQFQGGKGFDPLLSGPCACHMTNPEV